MLIRVEGLHGRVGINNRQIGRETLILSWME